MCLCDANALWNLINIKLANQSFLGVNLIEFIYFLSAKFSLQRIIDIVAKSQKIRFGGRGGGGRSLVKCFI